MVSDTRSRESSLAGSGSSEQRLEARPEFPDWEPNPGRLSINLGSQQLDHKGQLPEPISPVLACLDKKILMRI